MLKSTLHQFRSQHTPVRIEVDRLVEYARIDLQQGDGGKVEITSDDPAWLEELEGAVRAAREHLEARARLDVAS